VIDIIKPRVSTHVRGKAATKTSKYTTGRPRRTVLRHAAVSDNYRQSEKRSISAGEMYSTIRDEWAGYLGLT